MLFKMKGVHLLESKMYHYVIFTVNGVFYMKNSATEIKFFSQPVSSFYMIKPNLWNSW